ncbi:ATP-dependent Clp protease ATP-binding subunit [Pseudalkalibacillus berkeleyi]|uniref:AAA family ATPase n=1 Tax=Pseudalkalibacillus berkeleyi TaxID=1069813 RepID=A0ABS9GXL1_9BACL|nr:ATP-dependent Clp protease ATP-binding subunit [Pseudalkalibacillus berkeleyi]MCF6136323.1 AAA family ATPase [Pseudalkalibacillus berkeleyi]
MRCQHCQVNEANVRMTLHINGMTKQIRLCPKCYKEIQHEMKQPSNMNPFGGNDMNGFNMDDFIAQANQSEGQKGSGTGNNGGGLLDDLGRNLTDAAKAGLIDPVIGRHKEVDRVSEILNRRNKNNPVLIGEPGVGKTAIAEGLALKIANQEAPSKLLNKQVYLLDVSSLVANTGIRGQFEERMKQLIAEVKERKNVILFVDEIHLLVGAGSAEGSMDAGNILKPALARGELQVVGATTLKEYRQIEKDAALERRFQPVTVKEPTEQEAVEILQGLKEKYEQYHEIRYTDEALRACVTLSKRYIQDRFLPDKAIDLMDEAGSKMNLKHVGTSADEVDERLAVIAKEKEEATQKEDYERAAKLRDEELKLQNQMDSKPVERPEISVEDVQYIVEEKTGIPVRKLQNDEQNKLKNFSERLGSSVIGQDEAVEKVAKAIRRSRAGLKSKVRPIGAFLFVGPTGVGKTELTKTLAKELFGSKDAMIRLDMSEYMEKHAVSKLIGSPPGYVGHDEAGQLTERVRRNPYSIILLDEIEKAHPDVQHMFLQIMEDGRMTDSQGRTVSFKDTVIIMTSNAGTGDKKITVGFENHGSDAVSVLENLSAYFKPEFLNRFDSIIQFNELSEDHLIKIVDLMLDDIREMVKDDEREIEVTEEAKKRIASLGYDPRFGARPTRRVLQEKVEDGIADLLLDEENVTTIKVDVVEEEIVVKKG